VWEEEEEGAQLFRRVSVLLHAYTKSTSSGKREKRKI